MSNNDDLLNYYERNGFITNNGRIRKGFPALILNRHKEKIIELYRQNIPKTVIFETLKQNDKFVASYINYPTFAYFMINKVLKDLDETD